jgi:hypothetical protein
VTKRNGMLPPLHTPPAAAIALFRGNSTTPCVKSAGSMQTPPTFCGHCATGPPLPDACGIFAVDPNLYRS